MRGFGSREVAKRPMRPGWGLSAPAGARLLGDYLADEEIGDAHRREMAPSGSIIVEDRKIYSINMYRIGIRKMVSALSPDTSKNSGLFPANSADFDWELALSA
jgi:hypothetical protein